MDRGFRIVLASIAIVGSQAMAACRTSGATTIPTVSVTPTLSRSDEPISLSIGGLKSGHPVTVRMSSTDSHGTAFTSEAIFAPNKSGGVDVATTAPSSGSYRSVDAMGLLTSMSGPYGTNFYYWGAQPQTFTVAVSQANAHAQTTFERQGS